MGVENVKDAYTVQEWAERERYYITEIGKISIPPEPTTKDVMKLTSMIDTLLTEGLLDMAYIKRKYQNLDMQMKLAERETFAILKQKPPGNLTNTKLTENDIKGLVVKYLKSHPATPGATGSIYSLVQGAEQRFVFMDALVKMLSEKKGALISDNGMLKIESTISN